MKMVKVTILEQSKDFLIKEVRYKKAYFNRRYRDKIEIFAYFDESYNEKDNYKKS